MSDQTPASGKPDEEEEGPVRPRHQSAAERRSSETVMLDSGNLGDMVSQAKAEPEAATEAPAPAASSSDDISEEEQERKNVILIVGVAVIIVLAGLVGYLVYIAPD